VSAVGDLTTRCPEPELMEQPEQARAYAAADFAAPHDAFARLCAERFPELSGAAVTVADLGCGPADVTVRVARRFAAARVVGVDAGPVMLGLARERLVVEGLIDRIALVRAHLPDPDALHPLAADLVVSNSLLHHLADPAVLWSSVACAGRVGAAVFVMDLLRPTDGRAVDALVARYAAREPDVLVTDFRNSLRAAYRPGEVRDQLRRAGLVALEVQQVSDRHLVVSGRLPG